ncbi:hypothetical protein H8356DRAFT_1427104 [Neocallimastix lanati (nom. inval.)]|nr:hypothetical protein H8356DRAFT_1427104 [Neocallimastix sp. JGI-2020a]
MENFHEWLKTFLDKAIRDAEDSVYNYNNVRTEMDITTQMITCYLILREHEQSYKIKKDKYELLSKGKADILNYLQSMYDSMNIFYHQTINFFPEKRLINNSNNKKITPIQFESKEKHKRLYSENFNKIIELNNGTCMAVTQAKQEKIKYDKEKDISIFMTELQHIIEELKSIDNN